MNVRPGGIIHHHRRRTEASRRTLGTVLAGAYVFLLVGLPLLHHAPTHGALSADHYHVPDGTASHDHAGCVLFWNSPPSTATEISSKLPAPPPESRPILLVDAPPTAGRSIQRAHPPRAPPRIS
ncbi:MAG: hypothetical protein U5R14_12425 [Gemmatimonadota bacterium]|nr:hypothetical protein [Gemmatimonadota bacterium]